ncbi:hypothetical protein N9W41_00285 [bacterium]|nr:hypothetical protein [bacterium]MDB2425962.1 hypothetical protein [bacterium]
MKNYIKKNFMILSVCLGLAACSQQEISIDPVHSAQEMQFDLDQIVSTSSFTGGSAQVFGNLAKDPNTSIYYSKSGLMGSTNSVLAIYSLDWLRPQLSHGEIADVIVFFLDNVTYQGRQVALLVDVVLKDGTIITKIFDGVQSISVNGDEIEFVVSNGTDQLILRSFDLESGVEDLKSNIQLQVYKNINGSEAYLGKFSALMGFGQ